MYTSRVNLVARTHHKLIVYLHLRTCGYLNGLPGLQLEIGLGMGWFLVINRNHWIIFPSREKLPQVTTAIPDSSPDPDNAISYVSKLMEKRFSLNLNK